MSHYYEYDDDMDDFEDIDDIDFSKREQVE